METHTGDLVVFKASEMIKGEMAVKELKGVILGTTMGAIAIMTKGGSYSVRRNDIIKNLGSVFEMGE